MQGSGFCVIAICENVRQEYPLPITSMFHNMNMVCFPKEVVIFFQDLQLSGGLNEFVQIDVRV